MKAACLIVSNPFVQPQMIDVRRRMRIRALAPKNRVVVAVLNGRPVMRAEWGRKLADRDHLVFACLPAGGGGGGGSDPMRTLLSIALMSFAGPLATTILGGATSGLVFELARAGVAIVGTAALNALMPVARQATQAAPSPTYSLTAQGNSARIDAPIPVQYGRMLSWPDLAAQPYTEYVGGEQYLSQLLCLGCGEFDVEQIRIEDTPISAFAEIETQIVPPGGQVTLFPTAVVTSAEVSGQEMAGLKTATWSQVGTVVTVTQANHDRTVGQAVQISPTSGSLAAGVYVIATVPTINTFTVAAASATASGAANIHTVLGGVDGFVAAAAGSKTHRLAVDLILPLGLYAIGGSSDLTPLSLSVAIQARLVDDAGLPLGGWVTLGAETITDRTNTPIRKSFIYQMATAGRYRVRVWRTDAQSVATNVGHQVLFAGLRSYLTEPQDFGPVTLIAVRARATNNLSLQASRRIAVLATAKLPKWNGTTWSAPTATRSIAWAIAAHARATAYSAGLSDAEIDLDALLALDAVWAARGDFFDGRFDQPGTWWDALQKIARVGRAQCVLQGGVLRTVRDGPSTMPVAMFSERNIVRGSFKLNYLMPTAETADAVKIGYFDSATWSAQTVLCKLAGSTAAKPTKYQPIGITGRAHAQREGTFLAAVNRYRRRIATFSTEMEGRLPMFGDLIALQHSMPGWAQQAEVRGWDAGTRTLTLSEPMVFTGVATHYIALRRPDGSVFGPSVASEGATAYQVILTETPDFTPEFGSDRERTHISFGPGETWSARAKVSKITPRDLYTYDITAVIEDPAVHVADQGLTLPAVKYSQLPRAVTRPKVTGLLGRRVPDLLTKVLFVWNPAPNADSYHIEMAEGTDTSDPNVTWVRVADTTSAQFAAELLYLNRTMIRVRGVGLTAGPWNATTLGDLIPDFWLSDSLPFWSATDSDQFWSA